MTVSDLDRSVERYETLFGAPPFFVGDESSFRFAVWIEPMFALHQHHSGSIDGERFDEHRVGLDHIAFGCTGRDELECWSERLEALGIERGDILDAFCGSGLAFRDLDNVQLEFLVEAH